MDLSQYIPGPFATRQLSDLGAEVIKIEPPDGDPMRYFMQQNNSDISPVYQHLNRGKRICRLDLKSESGKAGLYNLLVDADVLLESFRPGVLARLGFDRDTLRKINAKLIHCALSGYGQTGPYRDRAGHDLNYCATSGMLDLTGTLERPVMTYPPMADHAGAMQASISILAALHARQRSKEGVFIDISLFETCLSWQYLSLLNPAEKRAESLLNGGAACYNIYQCADGLFVCLAALEAHFWQRFCDTVGKPQWIELQLKNLPQHELIGQLITLFAQQPRAYWDRLFKTVDCCYEALLLSDEVFSHPQIVSRKSLSHNAPAYPALINTKQVAIEEGYVEISPGESLCWSS